MSDEDENVDVAQSEEYDPIAGILAAWVPDDDDVSVKVYRVQGEGRTAKSAYLFTCTPDDFPLEDRLRDEYAGGVFDIRLLRKNQFISRARVVVEPPKKVPVPVQQRSETDHQVEIMRLMIERNEEMMRASMQAMTDALRESRNAGDSRMTMKEQLETLLLLKEAMTPPPQQPRNIVAEMRELMELRDELGGGEPQDGLMAGIKLLAGPLIEAARAQQAQQSQQTQPRPESHQAQSDTAALPSPATESTIEENPEMMFNLFAKRAVATLLPFALQDDDPKKYVGLVLSAIPDSASQYFDEIISDADFVERLKKADISVTGNEEWFAELGAHVCAARSLACPYADRYGESVDPEIDDKPVP